jgi:hypothetical protein
MQYIRFSLEALDFASGPQSQLKSVIDVIDSRT